MQNVRPLSIHRAFLLGLTVLAACASNAQTPPTVTNISSTPNPIPIQGASVTVTAKITGAASVFLIVKNSNGNQVRQVGMTPASNAIDYSGTVLIDPNNNNSSLGESILIQASDGANHTTTLLAASQAYDNTVPTVTAVSASQLPIPAKGGDETVTAKVADLGSGLKSVTLYEYYTDSYGSTQNPRQAPMLSSDALTYSATLKVDLNSSNNKLGEWLVVEAIDNAGNVKDVTVGRQLYSNVVPVVSPVAYAPDPLPVLGGDITVAAVVSDPLLGINTVTVYEYYTDSYGYLQTARQAPMTTTDGSHYRVTLPMDPNPNTGKIGQWLIIEAIDFAGNKTAVKVATQGYSNVPAGGSLPLLFTTDPAKPVLVPASANVGSLLTALVINGYNFHAKALVWFNGVVLHPTLVNASQIKVIVPASLLNKVGSFAVQVLNPGQAGPSAGTASNTVNFTVK